MRKVTRELSQTSFRKKKLIAIVFVEALLLGDYLKQDFVVPTCCSQAATFSVNKRLRFKL